MKLPLMLLLFLFSNMLPVLGENGNVEGFTQSRKLLEDEEHPTLRAVSMIKLIATPEKYSGQVIPVEGYLHVQPEDQRLYLCKEHGEYLVDSNALNVSFAKSNLLLQPDDRKPLPRNRDQALYKFDKKYVILVGKFTPGKLSEVTRVLESGK